MSSRWYYYGDADDAGTSDPIFENLRLRIYANSQAEADQVAEVLRNRTEEGAIERGAARIASIDFNDRLEVIVGEYDGEFAGAYDHDEGDPSNRNDDQVRIYIDRGSLTLSEAERTGVLAHEFAHAIHGDHSDIVLAYLLDPEVTTAQKVQQLARDRVFREHYDALQEKELLESGETHEDWIERDVLPRYYQGSNGGFNYASGFEELFGYPLEMQGRSVIDISFDDFGQVVGYTDLSDDDVTRSISFQTAPNGSLSNLIVEVRSNGSNSAGGTVSRVFRNFLEDSDGSVVLDANGQPIPTDEGDLEVTLEDRGLITGAEVGSIFGSALGRYLGGDNPWVSIGSGTVIGTLGLNIGEYLDLAFSGVDDIDINGLTNSLTQSEQLRTVFEDFGIDLQGQTAGAVAAFLVSELIEELGIGGLGGDVLSTITGQAASGYASLVVTDGFDIANSSFNVSWANLTGSFIGSSIANEIAEFRTAEGQLAGAIGGAVGGIIGASIAGTLATSSATAASAAASLAAGSVVGASAVPSFLAMTAWTGVGALGA